MSVSACLLLLAVAVLVFVMQAKKKRSLYGTYSPWKNEKNAPRMENIELKLKIPPEERLI